MVAHRGGQVVATGEGRRHAEQRRDARSQANIIVSHGTAVPYVNLPFTLRFGPGRSYTARLR